MGFENRWLGEGERDEILHRKLSYRCIAMMNEFYKLSYFRISPEELIWVFLPLQAQSAF